MPQVFCTRNKSCVCQLEASLNIFYLVIKYVPSLVSTVCQLSFASFPATPSSLLNSFATSEVQLQSSSPSQCGVTEQVNC